MIEHLLARGVDVNVQPPGSDFGIGAAGLLRAAGAGHVDTVARLLAMGADPEARDDVFDATPWAGRSTWTRGMGPNG